MNGTVSREEFAALTHRLDLIDERGTSKASGGLERDLAGLRTRLDEAEKEKGTNRRWVITVAFTAVAVLTAIASFVGTFILHLR